MARYALVLVGILLTGCAPTYLTVSAVHQSVPFRGPYAPPLGDYDRLPETTVDGLETGARWERGRWYWEGDVGYALRERNLTGGPWTATVRGGIRVRVGE